MASPGRPESPHLVSLVVQSKKALQHGEQLCSRANAVSNASAQCAVDVLALDAKVRWITNAVAEQLRLAADVAKSIEEKRKQLQSSVKEWDESRTRHANALDGILESLGTQYVPPIFHQASEESSLFGSQHDSEEPEHSNGHANSVSPDFNESSPTATLRLAPIGDQHLERKKWKTLRDFVDDRAIEDALEIIENDRNLLDDTLGKIDDYSETLSNSIVTIRRSLPPVDQLTSVFDPITSQDTVADEMARHLESLASHYDQMSSALHDAEAGEVFGEEDLQAMHRDTEELPLIMGELEENMSSIQASYDQLQLAKVTSEGNLNHLATTLDDLDELGEIMTEMLQEQQDVGEATEDQLIVLEHHLITLEHLCQQFLSYQTAFCKLILEMARRKQYGEAVENIVRGMLSQLDLMTKEETQVRNHFNEEHGAHLPEDICIFIGNRPTKWEVLPVNGETIETFPDIPDDLIVEARNRLQAADERSSSQSL
ncbi:hypothetical protein HGRIS_003802 [Hohenbuehelia grisea]|uniref:Autophagy-related protein 17 n=1 Tax=Hohenbuehelia grisea TaxID=104357 RepID=A0ABR3JHC8_9AGAR